MKDPDFIKMNSVHPLYLIIGETDGCFEEKNGSKYLILDSKDKNKEVFKKYTTFWDGIKNFIEKVNNKFGEYEKDFMKIRFNSDDNLLLNKTLCCYSSCYCK